MCLYVWLSTFQMVSGSIPASYSTNGQDMNPKLMHHCMNGNSWMRIVSQRPTSAKPVITIPLIYQSSHNLESAQPHRSELITYSSIIISALYLLYKE